MSNSIACHLSENENYEKYSGEDVERKELKHFSSDVVLVQLI